METGTYRARDGKDYAWVRLTLDGKYRRIKHDDEGRLFRTEKKAEAYGGYLKEQARRGQAVPSAAASASPTVSEYAWQWFDNRFADRRDRAAGSRRWAEGMIRCHIETSSIGARKLRELTRSEVERWIAERSVFGGGTLANSTLKMAVGLLRAIYATAVLDRVLDHSPVPPNKGIHWPRDGASAPHAEKYVPLSVDDVWNLAERFPTRYMAMPLVQAGLGLRIGELLALRECDIDFANKIVEIEWQFNDTEKRRGSGPGGRARPKSRHSRRLVPLPDEVAEVLRGHLAAFPPGPDGSVFTTTSSRQRYHHGGPLSHQYYGQQLFKTAMRAAGLPECSTHDLRHHYATELLAQGVRHETVAQYLGHADAGLVISTYGHAKSGGSDDVRDAVGRAWAARPGKAARHLHAVV
jgi:integrase